MKIFEDAPEYDSKGYGEANQAVNGEQLVIKECLHNGDVVFDAGANLGEWTGYALKQADVRAHAFEPVPETFTQLQGNIKDARVTLNQCALGANVGNRVIYASGPRHRGQAGAYGASSFFAKCLEAHDVTSTPKTVPVETLDRYCTAKKIGRIDFLKIDVEGAEYEVVSGAKDLLATKVIRCIQFEYGGCWKIAGTTLKAMFELLTGHGFVLHRILPTGILHIPVWHDYLEGFRYSNYLAILAKNDSRTN